MVLIIPHFAMAPFQTISLTFLLLPILSGIQAEDDSLSCPKHVIAKVGKAINILCKNNSAIVVMGMAFCSTDGSNCDSLVIIFDNNKIVPNNKNITVKIHNSEVILILDKVQISHQGKYMLHAVCDKSTRMLSISLEVFAPYTRPRVMKQNDIVVCTASGGYPETNLYWVSQNGTNLTYNSTSVSMKNEDGSFNLSIALQLGSVDHKTEQCCTFNNPADPSRHLASGGYPETNLYWVSQNGTNLIYNSTSVSVKNEDLSFNLSIALQLGSVDHETEQCYTFNNPADPCKHLAPACIASIKATLGNSKSIIPILSAVILLAVVLLAVVLNRRKNKGTSYPNIKNLFWKANPFLYQKA